MNWEKHYLFSLSPSVHLWVFENIYFDLIIGSDKISVMEGLPWVFIHACMHKKLLEPRYLCVLFKESVLNVCMQFVPVSGLPAWGMRVESGVLPIRWSCAWICIDLLFHYLVKMDLYFRLADKLVTSYNQADTHIWSSCSSLHYIQSDKRADNLLGISDLLLSLFAELEPG